MAMYMCPICGNGVSAGDKHICKPKPIPFNVFNDKKSKKEEEDFKNIIFKR